MEVINIHEREIDATPGQVGALIDSLASANDALWPGDSVMAFGLSAHA